jgi:F420-non-reducing hydrogenase iron-sulfur subunit
MMLEDFGLEPQRYRLAWVSASEGPRFAQVVTEMVKELRELGPSIYK